MKSRSRGKSETAEIIDAAQHTITRSNITRQRQDHGVHGFCIGYRCRPDRYSGFALLCHHWHLHLACGANIQPQLHSQGIQALRQYVRDLCQLFIAHDQWRTDHEMIPVQTTTCAA